RRALKATGSPQDCGEGRSRLAAQSFARRTTQGNRLGDAARGALPIVAPQRASVGKRDQGTQAQRPVRAGLGQCGDGRMAGTVEYGEASALRIHREPGGRIVEWY